MKRKRLVVGMILGILAALSIGVGVAFASGPGGSGERLTDFSTRVASILGVDQAQVQAAMEQAQEEMRAEAEAAKLEALRTRLDALVEAGQITQAEADEYYTWIEARPDNVPGIGGGRHGRGHRGHGGHFRLPSIGAEGAGNTTITVEPGSVF
ncbi:MAG: hypothetical protein O2854_07475 [Chloroflexi bacterium]|nr:hypothetical protein [Chloroflexota bacterium]